MRFAVQSTHAVPSKRKPLYLVKMTTLLICPECNQALGSYTNTRERAILEACHDCCGKQMHFGPVPCEPYN